MNGLCGPNYGNATCVGTDKPCCNGESWKCGATLCVPSHLWNMPQDLLLISFHREDCQAGTCYSGGCWGFPSKYSMDGRCGKQNKNLLCGGKWGDCCSIEGRCGSGKSFCDSGKCQSGNCTIIIPTPREPPPIEPSSFTGGLPGTINGISADGACGGPLKLRCGGSAFGNCCSSSDFCGNTATHCGQGR
jgi:hypothetical protein